MTEQFDRLEARPPRRRELALFRDLRAILKIAVAKTPQLRIQLRGVDFSEIRSRADLAAIPVIRRADLAQTQARRPPFGGYVAVFPARLKRLFAAPDGVFAPEGHAPDWWGAARALRAAGLAKGQIMLNCFSYHLSASGPMFENGAHELGCPVIAGGDTDVDGLIEAAAHLQPSFYAGAPDFLKVLLDAAQARGRDLSCLRAALVSGAALSPDLRAEFFSRGIEVRQAYATAELGVIAYESAAADGLIVNEGVIVEIVKPGTGEPVAPGEVGEVVVTRLNGEYPLTRYATGDLSAILPGPSPCGRTNMRLRGLLGRAEQAAKAADAPVRKVSRARPAGATPVAAQE